MTAPGIERIAVFLARTPVVLEEFLRGLPEECLLADEGSGTFSPHGVVGHLIQGEKHDWIPRARIILEYGEKRAFEPFDRFAQERECAGRTIAELLDTFTEVRHQSVASLLELGLDEEDLERRGTHPDLGPVTLGELLNTWVVHDLEHLAQIARVIAKSMSSDVGPWRAYLPLLDR